MTPEHDSRVRAARRRTQTEGSLCPSQARSSPLCPPPAPDSAQTAGSPSMAPGRSLRRRKVNRGEEDDETELPRHKGFGRPLVDSLVIQIITRTRLTAGDAVMS